jgi:hypothetical protein
MAYTDDIFEVLGRKTIDVMNSGKKEENNDELVVRLASTSVTKDSGGIAAWRDQTLIYFWTTRAFDSSFVPSLALTARKQLHPRMATLMTGTWSGGGMNLKLANWIAGQMA